MEYTGEHLLIGQFGNLFTVLAFAFSLLATVSYFLAERTNDRLYLKIGRISFIAHAASVMAMVATLFIMIFNEYYEYHYVWQHSNSEMPMKYIFSCFWEGVEGSFLIWTFWHVVLGLLLMKTAKNWEAPTMAVFSSVQVFMTSMLLGVFIFDYRIGSNPFTVLLREHPTFINTPLFLNPDYTSVLDGRGLNPLLQNYWMVIHPPLVLFGFATALPPFALAIAGLWRKQYSEWVGKAISWTFFGIGVLGTGVLMGGAWAYESLSFGGFWAWDPVENSSLVPWITMVGAGHLMLLQKKRSVSAMSLFVFTTITFCLVQYSSFLTKSGMLGDSSVHSFTDLGMTGQLLLSLLTYVGLSIFLIARNARTFPTTEKEESIWSREFWMFVGSLVLFVAAFQIIFSTSFPVINKLFGTSLATGADRLQYYNKWQTPIAVVLALLIAVTQFLKYSVTDKRQVFRNLIASSSISLAITITTSIFMAIKNPIYISLLFTSTLAVTANIDYWVRILSGKLKSAGASIAHIGFGLILLGSLISTSQSKLISENSSLFDITKLGENFDNNENILMMLNDTLMMGEYEVAFRGKKQEGNFIHYKVDYYQRNAEGTLDSVFTLYPYIQLNPRMGNVAEPYTKHYFNKDIYTHITYAELESRERTPKVKEHLVQLGDTIFNGSSFMILDSLDRTPRKRFGGLTPDDIAIGGMFTVFDVERKTHQLEPLFVIRDRSYQMTVSDSLPELGLKISFEGVNPESESFKFVVEERAPKFNEFIVMKAIIFPGINILWLGCIIMAIGTFFAVFTRIRKNE